eukprot:6055765-Pyramimonas_sp.AAC.1
MPSAHSPGPPRAVETTRREVFGRSRPLEAVAGPRDSQETSQDEKPVPGSGSRPPGVDIMSKS